MGYIKDALFGVPIDRALSEQEQKVVAQEGDQLDREWYNEIMAVYNADHDLNEESALQMRRRLIRRKARWQSLKELFSLDHH